MRLGLTCSVVFVAALVTGCTTTGNLGLPGDQAGAADANTSGDAPGSDPGASGDPTSAGDLASAGDPASAGDASPIGSGTILFQEGFEDTDWTGRAWYDGPNGALSFTEHIAASSASFECTFQVGAQGCDGGKLARHKFSQSNSVYLSFWIKHSANWQGSGRAYHPHMFHFVTNMDGDWVGPANSHLTTYIESPTGRPMLALQDSLNVDNGCILRNDDSIVGCGGDFSTYSFSENRSACACNGLVGDLDGRDCFDNGGYWYSSRAWYANQIYFEDAAGPYYKGDWHFIEAYFELNSIQAGIGVPDGRIRYWYDGELLISSDNILLRTGANPTMMFNQFLFTPYIGDGSPVVQSFWIDDLTVATAPL